MKYKVGDKVRVRAWEDMENEFGLDNDGDINCPPRYFTTEMSELCGKTMRVSDVLPYSDAYFLEGDSHFFTDEMLEDVCGRKIVITSDGKTTLARLYEDGKVTKTADVKCSPDDKFDFAVGAKLAFERLNEKHESKEPKKLFNGKAVCIEVDTPCAYTVGKIYEFKDGRTVIDNGCMIPCSPITSIEDWNARYPHDLIAKLLEIKE